MTHTEFVIINKSGRKPTFFTASSAYDRPRWVQIKEATKYSSDAAALRAVSKLRIKNILTAMDIIPLSEAIELVMPAQRRQDNDNDDITVDSVASLNRDRSKDNDDTDGDVVTSIQSNVFAPINPQNDASDVDYDADQDDDVEYCYCVDTDDEDTDDEDTDDEDTDDITNVVSPGSDGNGIAMSTGPQVALVGLNVQESISDKDCTIAVGKCVAPTVGANAGVHGIVTKKNKNGTWQVTFDTPDDRGDFKSAELELVEETPEQIAKRIIKEASKFKFPAKPANGGREDNDTTAATLHIPVQKMFNFDAVGKDYVTVAGSDEAEPVDVPPEVFTDLNKVIEQFDDCATSDGHTDRISYCMTVADALRSLYGALDKRTVSGIKQAQIKMSGFMNPITMMIPASVVKFIASGGRRSSLRGIFDQKRTEVVKK